MSASIMEIGRLTNGTRLPVSAYEEPYGSLDNSITVPFTALWAEARDGVANLVHFSFRNLHQILGRAEVDSSLSSQAASRASLSVNSRVISGSLGRGRAGAGRASKTLWNSGPAATVAARNHAAGVKLRAHLRALALGGSRHRAHAGST